MILKQFYKPTVNHESLIEDFVLCGTIIQFKKKRHMTSIWNPQAPELSVLTDHDVPSVDNHLEGRHIALLITGGIASIKAPTIARALRRYGADVVVYASEEALRYTTVEALEWCTTNPVVTKLTSASEHLCDSNPFDAYLVAPATYNTINKFKNGIADNVITTTLASALGRMQHGKSRILITPTMHGSMHNSILIDSLMDLQKLGVQIIPPRQENGKNNIPDTRKIVTSVIRSLSPSTLNGVPILVTGGPTPVPIDNVRRIVTRFRGRLGIAIANELYLRGADTMLIHGDGALRPPEYLPFTIARTYDDYYNMVFEFLEKKSYPLGIYSAAVADYRPEQQQEGKIPSGGAMKNIPLVSTRKVIDEVQKKFSDHFMVTFKYQENLSHDSLMKIAHNRIQRGFPAVVANRGEEKGNNNEQIAYLVTKDQELQLISKTGIAKGIADYLEREIKTILKET